jgi:V/A-type H+-transporting ATPase subunit I
MTSTSIICTKKDVESVLDTLNTFGEFHIEPSAQDDANIAEYNANISTVQERLLDIDGLIKQLVHEKGSFLGIFKLTQPVKVAVTADNWQLLLDNTSQEILTLKKEIETLNLSLTGMKEKNLELNHLRKMLSTMEGMGADLQTVGDLKLIYVIFASMPIKNCEAFQTAITGLPLFAKQSHLTEDECFLCVAAPKKHQEEVERILRTYHAEMFQMPSDLPNSVGEAYKEVKKRLKDNEEKEKTISEALKKFGEENKDKLASWKETSENILMLLTAEKKILQSGRLATVKGFVPKNKFHNLKLAVNSKMDGKALVLENNTIDTAHTVEPPTKIKHGRFVKPFEEITKLYGLPNYDEVDPTPFIAITFPILFGLMFGDLGHGLVLLIGGLVVGMLIKGNQGIKNVCWIMAACGIGAMVAGLLFGEFFGIQFTPLWFSPFENVFSFLLFSLFVGITQIISGIVIEMVNYLLKHDVADALLTALPKIAFFVGGVYLIAAYQLDFAAWLSGPILVPLIPFIIMVAGKPVYTMIAKPVVLHASEHPEQESLVGRFFEAGDFLTRLLSNTISYSRILALLMAHWALLLVVSTVAELINPAASPTTLGFILAAIVIVFGNIFVLALEGLIVFIHTLRLHFYEWFSKFYSGTGTEFSPFKQKFSHTELTLTKDEKQKV